MVLFNINKTTMKQMQLTINYITLLFHAHPVKHINNPVGRYRHRQKCMHFLHAQTKHAKYKFSDLLYLVGVQ